MKNTHAKNTILFLLLIITLVGFYFSPAIMQPNNFHQFADQRTQFNIPHFNDVISNLFFLIIGLLGIVRLSHINDLFQKYLYGIFFLSIFLVTFGSSYYHWSPNNFALIWDRIPISIAMMSFLTIIIDERISRPLAKILLPPLVIIALFTVLYWYLSELNGHGDLKPYLFTQVFPALFIPATLLLYPEKQDRYLWYAVVAYLIGRATEYSDHGIYHLTNHFISGHTLKHLIMALGIFFVYLYCYKKFK